MKYKVGDRVTVSMDCKVGPIGNDHFVKGMIPFKGRSAVITNVFEYNDGDNYYLDISGNGFSWSAEMFSPVTIWEI